MNGAGGAHHIPINTRRFTKGWNSSCRAQRALNQPTMDEQNDITSSVYSRVFSPATLWFAALTNFPDPRPLRQLPCTEDDSVTDTLWGDNFGSRLGQGHLAWNGSTGDRSAGLSSAG